jgi:predicted extracellular nuclease
VPISRYNTLTSISIRRWPFALALIAVLSLAAFLQPFIRLVPTSQAVSSTIVVSQVYGGGGNAGSTLTNDFIELFNRGNTTVSLSGWSVQYASATGSSWQVTNLTSVSLAPGQYYLVQEAQGAGGTQPLPTPDATGTIAMAAGAGKVALVSNTTALTCGATNNCLPNANIVDLVGYGATASSFEGAGPTPAPSASISVVRGSNGCTDTDNNSSDFTASAGVPVPHNTSSALAPCGGGGTTSPTGVGAANPNPVTAGSTTLLTVTVTPGTTPASTGITVTGNLTSIGGSATQTFFDNGTNGDATAGDNIFSFLATVAGATTGGSKSLPISIADAQARTGSTNISLTVQTPPVAVHDIQGSGPSSPLANSIVTTSGIVTGRRSNGFFLQTPDANADADPNTSEGIFVFTSSAPTVSVGDAVTVSGTVQEFIPASDPGSPPQTEIANTPSVSLNSTGNGLPAAITLTAADTAVNDVNNLEKYEGMRVHVNSLTVSGPTGGSIDEVNATSSSFGDFYGVITGVARPFREPGIEAPYPTPTPYPSGPAPASAQTFDANPERLRINSLGLTGSTDLQVSTNAVVTNITGPLDYGFRTYTIDTDPATTPTVSAGLAAVPVPTPNGRELTVASFNMQRFFDTTDDPAVSDVVLTTTAFNNRLNKASLAIRNMLNSPDVVGVEEMENLTTLQAVATKINNDEIAASRPNPNYVGYLVEGNDVGGIDVGFLVKSSRVSVNSVTQYNKTETFIDPNTGSAATLNDRPPLVLRASIIQPSGTPLSFSVVVNHLRSLGSVTLLTNAGAHTRVKRAKEAESLARLINEMQNGGPNAIQMLPYDQNIVSVGDYNSFQFNDGYDDVVGTVKGTPAPATQVVEASPDLNNPDLTDLIDTLPADQKYSYTFGGNAQALDHTLVNQNMMNRFSRFAYARMDADFSDNLRNDPNRPERISDHDPEVAYFNMAIPPTAAGASISGQVTSADGLPLAGAVIQLSGPKSARTITDAQGHYKFDNVDTGSFYTVAPIRANFSFSPSERSFSLNATRTDAVFTATALPAQVANPLDTDMYFVRQQYLDFLGREADDGGLQYWTSELNKCGADIDCLNNRRVDISAAFFKEEEYQQTGSFVYRLYKGALGRQLSFNEFQMDRSHVIGGTGLEERQLELAAAFVQRAEFMQKYEGQNNAESFVDALLTNMKQASGVDLSGQRGTLIEKYNTGRDRNESRSRALREAIEESGFQAAEYNQAFVLMEYFGYLQRDPDAGGYKFWLNVLNNQEPGNYRGMVCSFITSTEYQARFASFISHSNRECQ